MGKLRKYASRLSNTPLFQMVEVRGWDVANKSQFASDAPIDQISADLPVFVNGVGISKHSIVSIVVDLDLDQPSMCTIIFQDHAQVRLGVRIGSIIVVRDPSNSDPAMIFKGEVVGVEPYYRDGRLIIVRAFSRLHRLARERKSPFR